MNARIVQPGLSVEYILWIFARVSGVGLLALGLVGLVGAFVLGAGTQIDIPTLMRWTFFPNPNHVINSGIPDVTLGWANAFWKNMQLLIVLFGVSHAFNGLRVVAEDFIGTTMLRPFLRGLIILLWMFSLLAAIYVVLGS
jgi:succinate dehydrogenase hydrophobic anchor subunit